MIATDLSVEEVHFRRRYASARDIGHRALAVNLSDLAAMGARPVLATIGLTIPSDVEREWLLEAYRGIAELAASSRIAVVGGDISRGPVLSFAITVVGEVSPTRLTLRSGARVRDILAVTGRLGRSRAGLALLEEPELRGCIKEAALLDDALQAHLRPQPRLAYGKFLAASAHVHAMMDLSDGLSLDLARLARASGCGALLTEVPLAASTEAIAGAANASARAWALRGGEDYELLIAVERRAFPHLAQRFAKHFGASLFPVGHCTEGDALIEEIDGEVRRLEIGGYDHLALSAF